MTAPADGAGRPVAVVTGGGGGIGAAIAEELGRTGWFVVPLDPLVSLDGAERLPEPEETTVDRIVAAGGRARASTASVTDAEAVRETFADLVREFGRLDAVVNVAGISRPTGFATGTEQDWRAVLDVHLNGYRNVLEAALPLMAAAGRGRILGVTSGSGWRAADAGAYSCAKRAVAALSWQLGQHAPAGVSVNALSPIAVTRMVTSALRRPSGGVASTAGLSLSAMPTPKQVAPLAAHLVGHDAGWCSGQVLFAGGPEVAVLSQPHLVEVASLDRHRSLAQALEVITRAALVPAESAQGTTGGGNPRFDLASQEEPADPAPPASVRSCAIITDRPGLLPAITSALEDRGVSCHPVPVPNVGAGFAGAADALAEAVERAGPIDAVVVALSGADAVAGAGSGWERTLYEHERLVQQILADAGWSRAVAEYAARRDRPMRLVTLTDASTTGGRSRAQAAAQLARAGRSATNGQVCSMAVSVETAEAHAVHQLGSLVAHLLCSSTAVDLAGGELATGSGWIGLRSHPRPRVSIAVGSGELPAWFGRSLRQSVEEAR